ncbi:hypothetical protein VTN77DRAFT_9380 [Rasamsonia byssochlamydoides]|uniref:uncharacterized protein n=1 Tax=Rasamsonia byssochlamydoides TaxID=89139 RepID=UPI0037445EAD
MSTAIDNLADNLASTTINEPANGTAQTDAAAASADEGRRLYIGNLAYATTEGELKEFFKNYTIESVSIPVNPRTNRPVGYAFVDLATAQEAQSAIQELSGKEILQRKVSVQVARKPEPAEAKAEGAVSGGEGGSGNEGRKRGAGRGRGRGRGRGGRFGRGGRPRPTTTTTTQAAATQNGEAATGAATNVPGQAAPLTDGTNAAQAAALKETKPRGRPQKQRGPPEDGIPSKTKVMVANLPYDLSEEKLKEIFKDYQPVSAKIALRPIPRFMVKKLQARNEPRKGRGFGFVTLGSEELQQKAVQEMNGKEIEGREIAVKVAIDSPGKEDVVPGEAGTQQPAEPAAGTAQENTAPAAV